MAERYDDSYREDVERLVALGAEAGLSWSEDRAFRAWSFHSEERFAGWIVVGGTHRLLLQALRDAERDLRAEDAKFAADNPADVAALVACSDAEGFGLTGEDVTRIWVDRSACAGEPWLATEGADLPAILGPHAAGQAPAP